MTRKSTQIALGGVFSSLCLLMMFLTGLMPFSTYALPALAGAMLIPVVVELGKKTAALVYVSVSLLSLFIAPDREAAVMFIAFFGYYPIAKEMLEKIKIRSVEVLIKLLIFNASMIFGYLALVFLLGLPFMQDEMGDFGRYAVAFLLLSGNVVFFIYDFALTRFVKVYIRWFKPRFLRK